MKKIITLDSQILNTIQLCERRTQYAFVDAIVPSEKGEALERGDLMHKMLEVYEGLRCNLVSFESETWKTLHEFSFPFTTDYVDDLVGYTEKAARLFATKMDISSEQIEEVIYQFKEYVNFYSDDAWETLSVEEVGTKELWADDLYTFLYSFKIDRLARKDQIIAPWDYKTSMRRKETSSLSNQFIGYAWATKSNYVIIDKIGFQKTLAPSERFQRVFLSYDNDRIKEWHQNSVYWAYKYAKLLEDGKSTMNLTSCDKYAGCIYRKICESSPEARPWIIDRDYRVEERWNPAKVLEQPKEEPQAHLTAEEKEIWGVQ